MATARPAWRTAVALLLCVVSIVSVEAGVAFTNDAYAIQAGKPFLLTWTGAKGPVTIRLMNGPDEDLQPVLVIASGYSGTSFSWTPLPTLPTDGYELELNDGQSTDYSARFQFLGAAAGGSAQPSGTATTKPTSSSLAPTTTSQQPATVTQTVSTTPTPSGSAQAQGTGAQDTSGGLSTGAKIGIGVGAGVAALLVLALLVFCFSRQRRRGRAEAEAAHAAAAAAAATAPSSTFMASPSYTFQTMSSPATELEPPKLERPWGDVGTPMNRAELWGAGRRMDASELDVSSPRY